MWGLLWTALIGIAAGWLAGQITKTGNLGLVGNLIIGVVGAMLGNVVFRVVGLAPTWLLGQLIVATIGSVALIAIIRWVQSRKI
ncbi:MAG: GlsB/YeaQ/YmgE family stress response membrane protein [Pirellulales bacterium]